MNGKGANKDELDSCTTSTGITSSSRCPRRAAVLASIAIMCIVLIGHKGNSAMFLQDATEMRSTEEFVELAKLAEQTERNDEMLNYMKQLTIQAKELNDEQRNLLSVAFKRVVGAKRSAFRIISSIEQKKTGRGDESLNIVKNFRMKIEKELSNECVAVIRLIDDHLLKSAALSTNPTEAKVFYLMMKGDYSRYMAEVTTGDQRSIIEDKAKEAYSAATEEANMLPPTHPLKLGLALNFSIFYYEIKGDVAKACALAKNAFDKAIEELDSLKEDSYKDSTHILQLLRDNLTLWSSEGAQDKLEVIDAA